MLRGVPSQRGHAGRVPQCGHRHGGRSHCQARPRENHQHQAGKIVSQTFYIGKITWGRRLVY